MNARYYKDKVWDEFLEKMRKESYPFSQIKSKLNRAKKKGKREITN